MTCPPVEFYKRKQVRYGGNTDRYVEAIRISPAEGQYLSALILKASF